MKLLQSPEPIKELNVSVEAKAAGMAKPADAGIMATVREPDRI